MNLKRLMERVPADREAEERVWSVVRAAYAEREPVRRKPRRRLMLAAVALAAAVAAAALSPPGQAVVDAVRRSIGISHAAPALFRLPAPGRVLVSGDGGTWVVSVDGSKRRLGDYRQAAWSPHALYVIAATSTEVAAIEPLVKCLGIQIAGALVDQVGDEIANAGLVGRILGRAAAEGIFHRDQRHGGILHEPGFDAFRRNQMLDLRRRARRRRCHHCHCDTGNGSKREPPRETWGNYHERFSSRFCVVSLIK